MFLAQFQRNPRGAAIAAIQESSRSGAASMPRGPPSSPCVSATEAGLIHPPRPDRRQPPAAQRILHPAVGVNRVRLAEDLVMGGLKVAQGIAVNDDAAGAVGVSQEVHEHERVCLIALA